MNKRRASLVVGLSILVVSAARHGNAATGEVAVEGYGGQSTGGWICGPVGPMRYGGGAVSAKLASRSVHDRAGEGLRGDVGVAAEWQSTRFHACTGTSCDRAQGNLAPPPERVLAGGQLKVGYHARHWGVDAGGGVYQGFRDEGDQSPSVAAYPQIEGRGGVAGPTSVFGVVGFGSALPTMVQRPGLYTGVSVDSERGFAIDARVGAYRQGPALTDGDSIAGRLDVGARVDLGKHVGLKVGGAVGVPAREASMPNLEGSGGVVAKF